MRKLSALLLALTLHGAASAQDDANLGIIPAPASIKKARGEFKLTPETMIMADSPNHRAARYLANYMKKAGLTSSMADVSTMDKKRVSTKNTITLQFNFKGELPPEGYELEVWEDHIMVKGHGAGMFYGVQTLIQLMNNVNGGFATLPCVTVKDNPRFAYRGMHLDVARHFFDVAFIKKYLDVMAAYKLNTFHWHLTDDQGWRIEIKKYPKLTEIGSKRAQTKIGKGSVKDSLYDNTPYGGFYTQDQIREVIAYANDRFISIVPEIDMPGHSLAAIAAYPELSCDPSKQYKVGETWGTVNDILCPTPETFKMINDILTEVLDLFPGKYMHIGGDEVSKIAWKQSEFCRQLIAEQNLGNADGLQSYFIKKLEQMVEAQGRSIIGWDEILEGGLPPRATVMSWTSEKGGIAAAQMGHDVIMTPSTRGMYFDHYQSKSQEEPMAIGGHAPLSKVYNYEPVPEALNADQAKHVIGVQANLWTEYITTPAKVEYMLLPRMLALSEIAWTPKNSKDYKNFSQARIPRHLPRLEAAGYNYRVPEPIGAMDTTLIGEKFTLEVKPSMNGANAHYTLDGFPPRETDRQCTGPLTYIIPEGKQIEFKSSTVTSSGKRSVSVSTKMKNIKEGSK